MKVEIYGVSLEYGGAFIGTMEMIEEWLIENDIYLGHCTFYRIAEEIDVGLKIIENNEV